jgi:chromosomal replication initiation ATPase DnaA
MKPRRSDLTIPDWYPQELKDALVEKIVFAVTGHCKMTIDEILVKTKEREVVYPRQLLHYFLYHYSGLSSKEIGLFKAPYYTHMDVLHSNKVIIDLLQTNEETKRDCDTIRELIHK